MDVFLRWLRLKSKLNSKTCKAPYVNVGDIWWVSLGCNIGSEVNGKSELFSRPAVVFKKFANGFYLVIPTTTKVKKGSWYISFKQKGVEMQACLHQIRAIDYRRFWSKLGELDDSDYKNLKMGFGSLFL